MSIGWGFSFAFLLALATTYGAYRLGLRLGVLDRPGELKIHERPVPRIGGLGIAAASLITVAAGGAGAGEPWLLTGILLVGVIVAATGFVDDLINLRPVQKLSGQILGGLLLGAATLPYVAARPAPWLWWVPLTALYPLAAAFLVTLFSNGFNLLDGMDGMLGGLSLIATLFLGVIAWLEGHPVLVLTTAASAGATLAFLFYNRPPARTFMGDSGSLFLGAQAAAVGAVLVFTSASVARALAVAVVLAVPLADTFLAVVRRFRSGGGIMSGDRLHLYDCIFLATGGRIWPTLWIAWGIGLTAGLVGLAGYAVGGLGAVVLTGVGFGGLLSAAYRLGAWGR